jgi:hypothetical protein
MNAMLLSRINFCVYISQGNGGSDMLDMTSRINYSMEESGCKNATKTHNVFAPK